MYTVTNYSNNHPENSLYILYTATYYSNNLQDKAFTKCIQSQNY